VIIIGNMLDIPLIPDDPCPVHGNPPLQKVPVQVKLSRLDPFVKKRTTGEA
jgi:hypothetical protein